MTTPGQIVELDVRPHLRNKLEPFKIIMDTVKSLKKEDTFILHATLKPTPLFALMKTKGYVHAVEKKEEEHWVTVFLHKSRKHELAGMAGFSQAATDEEAGETDEVKAGHFAKAAQAEAAYNAVKETEIYRLDNRGLEPPQPMLRTLKKLETLNAGDELIIHNDRVPMFLIEELNTLGYTYRVEEQEDGSALIHIHKS